MKPLSLLLAHIALILSYNAHAQVDTDGSMGEEKHLSGNMTIPQSLGTTSGHNLFHSFSHFNIDKNETVNFTGDNQLKNVISRVTGGEISKIDGVLKSEIGQANFYFINSAGIVFGTNATVDVPAAFHISTSDSLNFKDGQAFLASLTANNSSLSISEPTDFGFLGDKAGDIIIKGNSGYIPSSPPFFGRAYFTNNDLNFNAKNDVLLNANNITINHATLSNPSGSITINAKNNLYLNDSSIDNSTLSSNNAGKLNVTANTIKLVDSSIQSNANQDSTGNAGIIAIQAKKLTIENSKDHDSTGIQSRSYSTGDANTITINSDTVTVKNNGIISVSTFDKGYAGNIDIKANDLIIDSGFIASNSNSTSDNAGNTGNAGNITLNSSSIEVDNSGEISSNTSGTGNAGTINIQQAKLLTIDNSSHIYSNAELNSAGNAGSVIINSDNITAKRGGQISSSTSGTGLGGSINLVTKQALLLDGGSIKSESNNKGNAGAININSDTIALSNAAWINSSASSAGKAGNITIQTNMLTITGNNSRIAALATSGSSADSGVAAASGYTGNIAIIANKALHLDNYAQITIENGATVKNPNAIELGSIHLVSPDITLNNTSLINAQSTGNISAGLLMISFEHHLSLNNGSAVTAHTAIDNGGNVIIKGGELINLHNAIINTYTDNNKHAVKGGDIKITADVLLLDNAQILSRAENASNGGYANLTLKGIIASGNQLVVNGKTVSDFESSKMTTNIIRTADSGWTTPQLNITGSITALNRNTLELPDLNKGSCNDSSVLNSSLVHSSKGGIAISEAQSVFIPSANAAKTEQLRTAITPFLATTLTEANYSCVSISL